IQTKRKERSCIMTKIGVIVGSLRKESFSKKIANNLMDLFPKGYEMKMVPISNLQLYNQDFDDYNEVPDEYTAFRNKEKECDALLFVIPYYNRYVTGVLKIVLYVD